MDSTEASRSLHERAVDAALEITERMLPWMRKSTRRALVEAVVRAYFGVMSDKAPVIEESDSSPVSSGPFGV